MPLFKTARAEAMAQYVLFTILVVLTPFVVVTRYLQGAAHIVSHLSFPLFGVDVPFVLVTAIAGLTTVIIWQAKNLTWRKGAGITVITALILISQQTMDIYLQMSFFDLQQNWHYIAYGAYAFFFFRAFNARNMPKNRMILFTFFSAIGMSLFDETFQFFMSDRVFDISDIVKDALGVYIGLILVLFVTETYGTIPVKNRSVTQRRLSDYVRDPLSALVMLGVLTLSSVLISPLLTDHENWFSCVVGCLSLFALVMLIIHLIQYKPFRIAFITIASLSILLLAGSFVLHADENVTHNAYALTVYKGIPIPFFDLVIYPDGSFQLVDKKHQFRDRDKDFYLKKGPDILLIGSGSQGNGGKGFDVEIGAYFKFNVFTSKGTQVIVLPTPEACEKFNQLKAEGKLVILVLHNTC
jgi:VanZ family protein